MITGGKGNHYDNAPPLQAWQGVGSKRAGDRTRTGDVQLGNLIERCSPLVFRVPSLTLSEEKKPYCVSVAFLQIPFVGVPVVYPALFVKVAL